MGRDGSAERARAPGARLRRVIPASVANGELSASARRAARNGLETVLPSTAYPTTPWAARRADGEYAEPATPGWREIDWSAHVHDVEVEGRPIRYVDIGAGDAPPLVFVHGLGGNWQNWLENIPAQARGRRVLALDLPGFGDSPKPASEISIPGYADLVEAWLERLEVGHAVLAGNSMGGFVAAEVAIDYPARVERLALVAAAGISITNLRRRLTMTAARMGVALGALTASRSREIVARERLRHIVLSPVIRHPARMRPDLLYEILQGSGKPGFVDGLDALTSYDCDRLDQVTCPTLIVWGREDVLVPVKDADEFERLIPRSRQVVMDDTGHMPMLERPEAFNRCLEQFLADEVPIEDPHGPGAAAGAPGSDGSGAASSSSERSSGTSSDSEGSAAR